jgi:hypothetical protein
VRRRAWEAAATTLTSTQYYAYPGQGRITRLSEGTRWGRSVVVTYVPADDRPLRTQVLIELVRQALEQTAMAAESSLANIRTPRRIGRNSAGG